jgi:hypothetical protein
MERGVAIRHAACVPVAGQWSCDALTSVYLEVNVDTFTRIPTESACFNVSSRVRCVAVSVSLDRVEVASYREHLECHSALSPSPS